LSHGSKVLGVRGPNRPPVAFIAFHPEVRLSVGQQNLVRESRQRKEHFQVDCGLFFLLDLDVETADFFPLLLEASLDLVQRRGICCVGSSGQYHEHQNGQEAALDAAECRASNSTKHCVQLLS
jgi:hypothetical protein